MDGGNVAKDLGGGSPYYNRKFRTVNLSLGGPAQTCVQDPLVPNEPPAVAAGVKILDAGINATPLTVPVTGPSYLPLPASSPAINQGSSSGAAARDIRDMNRIGLPDPGAFEWIVSGNG